MPRIEIVVDPDVPCIPEVQVVDESGEIIGSSAQTHSGQRKVDVTIHRLGTSTASAVQQIDAIPIETVSDQQSSIPPEMVVAVSGSSDVNVAQTDSVHQLFDMQSMVVDAIPIETVSDQQFSIPPEMVVAESGSSDVNVAQTDSVHQFDGSANRMKVVISSPQPRRKEKVNVADISPLPTVRSAIDSGRKRGRKRRTTKAAILTSSPYKIQLEENQNNKNKKIKVTTGILSDKSTSKSTQKPACKSTRRSKKYLVATDRDDDIRSWYCKLCDECVKENMIKCQQCNSWVHCECAGVSRQTKRFICDLCN